METHLNRKNPRMLTNVDEKPHAISFSFNQRIDVDMLISPYWREPSELYKFLKDIPQSERFKYKYNHLRFANLICKCYVAVFHQVHPSGRWSSSNASQTR